MSGKRITPTALWVAFRFLTVLPLGGHVTEPPALSQSVAFFPLVGLALGAILAFTAAGAAQLFPPPVAAVLVLALWVGLTGGLHLDGFLDACDGLFGGRTPEERLRIMRDEQVGAFAVVGGVLLLLAKHAALATLMVQGPLSTAALLVVPTLGRGAMAMALVRFPYARKAGLGTALKAQVGHRELGIALFSAFLVAGVALGWAGLALGLGTVATTALFGRWVARRVGGFTGDLYGALCEVTEALLLVTLTASAINWPGFAFPFPFGHP